MEVLLRERRTVNPLIVPLERQLWSVRSRAQFVVEAWRIEYNTYRPHSALDGRTPGEYAATWTSTTQPILS